MTKMTLIMGAIVSTLALAGCATHTTEPPTQTMAVPAPEKHCNKHHCHCHHHHCHHHDLKSESSTN